MQEAHSIHGGGCDPTNVAMLRSIVVVAPTIDSPSNILRSQKATQAKAFAKIANRGCRAAIYQPKTTCATQTWQDGFEVMGQPNKTV
jgi:hypothetical protein